MLLDNHTKQSPIVGVAGLGGGINSYIFLSSDGGSYEIARSLRFNSGDSAYLSTTTPNITTFTYSAWIKRCGSGRDDILVSGSSTGFYLYFHTDGTIKINTNSANIFTSNGQYRDSTAWYNICFSNDGSTFKLYVNGVLDKSVSLTTQLYSGALWISRGGGSDYADYYLADVHFVDGQALLATSFGSFDSDVVWQPGTYSGSHGTNGSHLDFKNYGSTANLGKDSAGSNNWTVNNFSVTAGVANDSLLDHPIQESPTDTGKGAEVRGNYCTLSALENNGITLSNGNLDVARSTNSWASSKGTIGVPSGKYYFEYTVNSGSSYQAIGIHKTDVQMPGVSGTGYIHVTSAAWVYQTDGNLGHANAFTNTGVTSSSGDVVMVAFDVDSGKVWFGKNGTWFSSGNPATGANPSYANVFNPAGISPATSIYGTQTGSFNFGQRVFNYEAPSSFKCLNAANLSTPSVADGSDFFEPLLYTGNGSARNITGLSFSPDLVFLKNRDRANYNWYWVDILRGSDRNLFSNSGEAEQNAARLSSLNSDGFGLTDHGGPNYSGDDYVAYCFDGGSSNTSVSVGGANAAAYNQSSTWSNNWTASGNGFGSNPPSNGFDNNLDNNINNAAGGQYITWNTTSYTLSGSLEINCYSSSGVYDVYVNGAKAADTPSSRGWLQCGSFNDINEIQFGGTSHNSSTGLGAAGIVIYEIKVGGRTLIDSGASSLPSVPTVATTYRANPSSGFSVVTWSGNGNDNASVVHGLNSEPGIVIIKNRSTATSWHTYVRSLDPNGRYQLYFNSNAGSTDFGAPGFFNADYARINLIGGSSGGINASGYNFVAWCFAPVAGYSAMGSYIGNGSTDGTFVHTGFKVAFLLTKRTDTSENWEIRDNKRNTHNRTNRALFPHTGGTEDNGSVDFDFLSNGFKLRNTNGSTNASGGTYMYYAIAEHPFKTARAH
jgi:hypothetical protein